MLFDGPCFRSMLQGKSRYRMFCRHINHPTVTFRTIKMILRKPKLRRTSISCISCTGPHPRLPQCLHANGALPSPAPPTLNSGHAYLSSTNAKRFCPRPTVYLPSQPSNFSRSDCCAHREGEKERDTKRETERNEKKEDGRGQYVKK